MYLKILDFDDKKHYESDIIKILTESDKDFVPPLSARKSTLDKKFDKGFSDVGGIHSYFEEMKKQEILATFEDGKIIGFVSYRLNFVSEDIPETELPNIYVSTLVLGKEARGKGLTKKMYAYLFSDLYADRNVFTRTWSTNYAHTKILSDFGFSELYRKENDRGAGIDTVYYKKKISEELLGV